MTAAVVTWTGARRHHPHPDRPARTLCGRRIDTDTPLDQLVIDYLSPCSRCQKASTT